MIRTGGEKNRLGKDVFHYGVQSDWAINRGRFPEKTPA
jgi:hypothetical protein